MSRSKEELDKAIKAVRQKLVAKYGFNVVFGYNLKYIDEYDEQGNWIGAHIDPEQEKLATELRELEEEKRLAGYDRIDRGEYGGFHG